MKVAQFLTDQFNLGKAYNTLGGYRSTLSNILPHYEGSPLGSHPLICRLFRGFYNLRPTKPRYDSTWSVDSVLSWVRSNWPENADLSLKFLAFKTVLLVALSRPSRANELHGLDPRSIQVDDCSVSFSVLKPLKNQKSGPLKRSSFDKCTETSICARQAIIAYLAKTETLRTTESQKSQFFISFRKPFNPVTVVSLFL